MNGTQIVDALERWLDARQEEQLSPCGRGAARQELEDTTARRKQALADKLNRILEP